MLTLVVVIGGWGLLCAVVIWWLGIDCVLRVGFTLVVISVGVILIWRVAVCLCLLTLLSGVFGVVGTAVLLLAIVVISVGVLLAWFSVGCECLFNSVGFLDSLIVLLSLFVVLGGWQFCACMVRLCLVVLGWVILVGFVGCLGGSVLWWFV